MAKFRRRTRTTVRKRRFTRKRKFVRKAGPKYDGMVKVKMQANKEMLVTGVNGEAEFRVNWGDQITGAAAGAIGINDCPEKARYFNLYNQWCV